MIRSLIYFQYRVTKILTLLFNERAIQDDMNSCIELRCGAWMHTSPHLAGAAS
ncbi:hypothetical protein N2599_32565 (plasmid) [Rhizobium sullae]|uniref:Uncharacterized protein n=1 Tax=Rhizobium sullae TaxID=50338 RepID=A0ABY5XS78_RHISU|nr:hypothetical protein [Rhizobium sullae]UWU17475.1 hypothetical protein N2599_32565 [Rhizobium sullae]